ncbi:MAG: ammonia-forming cytochrome c nitrite reductase [Prolixibacteraceae bacterium]|jgi:nitrite reductase (cytochrome c-552)|nr:ammonia-forming cytochrome c nitrite reductase [Prolixibacteraceae bacterium]
MKPINQLIKEKPIVGWLIFIATIVIVFVLGLFASSIVERRAESVFVYTPKVEHSQFEPRNEVWGQNFPRQYQSYLKTADTTFRSKHQGSATIDMLEESPRMVVLWAGYAFSRDYKQSRGHANAVNDVHHTLRIGAPIDGNKSIQPNTCWTCKSPDVPRLMNEIGVAEFYKGSWEEKGHEIVNAIGCADCHDAQTMNLRISRPALVEAFNRRGIDITKSSHQDMRSLVCAQCHVEYYFNKKKIEGVQYLTFPWDNGLSVDAAEAYYDNIEFTDWTHTLSKAPMLKAQHPDYELYKMGTHASRGVSCADCHMPYMSEGGQKFTDHHVQSPLNNVANSCQVCHREETDKLIADVYERQDKLIENKYKLEEIIVRAHVEAQKAWDLGATEEQMKAILTDIRHAQWRWDYVAASHAAPFHAPVESARIISSGMVKAQDARVKLARVLADLGFNKEVPYPDISTKAKAQQFIGLDMEKFNNDRKRFLDEVVPQWLETAKQREANYNTKEL